MQQNKQIIVINKSAVFYVKSFEVCHGCDGPRLTSERFTGGNEGVFATFSEEEYLLYRRLHACEHFATYSDGMDYKILHV